MSRAGDGTYTAPLADVVTGDTIEAAWANTTIADLETALTDSLSRSGSGNMSVPLKVVAGTVSAPGLSFVSEANSGLYRAGAGDIRMALLGNELFRMTATGVRIADQDITMGTAGKGIDFSANTGTAASGATTTSERLTFFEEGTWTPKFQDGSLSDAEGQTYANQVGYYTRLGNRVFFNGSLQLTAAGTLGGNVRLLGLPFVCASNYGSLHCSYVLGVSTYNMTGYIGSGVSYALIQNWDGTSGSEQLQYISVTIPSTFIFHGQYIV